MCRVAAAKFAAYSQVEVVRASMLSRHVKAGGAKVLQLGGSTKDIFYYPEGTVQVAVLGPEVNAGLWEQAGMSAGKQTLYTSSERFLLVYCTVNMVLKNRILYMSIYILYSIYPIF